MGSQAGQVSRRAGAWARRLVLSEYLVLVLGAAYYLALVPLFPEVRSGVYLNNLLLGALPLLVLALGQMFVLLTGGIERIAQRHYILADNWDPSPFRHFAAKLAGKPGWEVTTMKVGHDIMVDMPQELAEFLLRLA